MPHELYATIKRADPSSKRFFSANCGSLSNCTHFQPGQRIQMRHTHHTITWLDHAGDLDGAEKPLLLAGAVPLKCALRLPSTLKSTHSTLLGTNTRDKICRQSSRGPLPQLLRYRQAMSSHILLCQNTIPR